MAAPCNRKLAGYGLDMVLSMRSVISEGNFGFRVPRLQIGKYWLDGAEVRGLLAHHV